ncbi:MAG: helix-turn-helix transcriptional regulator [Succinivibrio sp.]|nr:helix-turn-helix transcriptional regulator [Succinivibrio sp.]
MTVKIETLAERLKFALKKSGKSRKDLAQYANVSSGAISQWVNGGITSMSSQNAQKVSEFLGVSNSWLITGKGDIERSNIVPVDNEPDADFIPIPAYNKIEFGAGERDEPTPDEIEDTHTVSYRSAFFRSMGVNPRNCRRYRVDGDSMEPLLRDGDYILCDCTPTTVIIDNAIYAFVYGNQLKVKHLIKTRKGLIIRSENPIYPEELVPPEEVDEQIHIIGKVIERSGII